jgi:hypothetical protein
MFLAMVTPLAVLLLYFGLNYSGFCFVQMRHLSNEEKFQSVFDYHFETRRIKNDADKKEQLHTFVEDNNFEEYFKKNPECCKINPGGPYELPPPSFLDRITGYNSGDVIVMNFRVSYLDKNGKQTFKKYQVEHIMQNCGKVKW